MALLDVVPERAATVHYGCLSVLIPDRMVPFPLLCSGKWIWLSEYPAISHFIKKLIKTGVNICLSGHLHRKRCAVDESR